ncbi:hypothetical protein HAP94_19430 [Acidithiobacillus ferrivorans]|nr:hypothetical protein [Acidithiobacillus ferrivorans]
MHADRNDNNPVKADRLCGLLNHEGMADVFADFKASKGRLKMYSGGVSITPDGDVTVVSDRRGGDFINLTEKEAKGLNRGDEVSLTRKSVDSEFNVCVLRQDRARELNLY